MNSVSLRRALLELAAVSLTVAAVATLCVHSQTLPVGTTVDRIVIDKRARTLTLFHDHVVMKTYKVALGRNPQGHKQREGDGRTPEGSYVIDSRKRDSAFHRALHISYPNADDRLRARARGVAPGGAIMIHGLPNGQEGLGKAHV